MKKLLTKLATIGAAVCASLLTTSVHAEPGNDAKRLYLILSENASSDKIAGSPFAYNIGLPIYIPFSNKIGGECTISYPVTVPSKPQSQFFLTAGHCFHYGTYTSNTVEDFKTREVIGHVAYSPYHQGSTAPQVDYALVEVDPGKNKPLSEIGMASPITIHNPQKGELLGIFGAESARHNRVINPYVSPVYLDNGKGYHTMVLAFSVGALAKHGDSGAPISTYISDDDISLRDFPVGIEAGGSDTIDYVTPYSLIFDSLNKTPGFEGSHFTSLAERPVPH